MERNKLPVVMRDAAGTKEFHGKRLAQPGCFALLCKGDERDAHGRMSSLQSSGGGRWFVLAGACSRMVRFCQKEQCDTVTQLEGFQQRRLFYGFSSLFFVGSFDIEQVEALISDNTRKSVQGDEACRERCSH